MKTSLLLFVNGFVINALLAVSQPVLAQTIPANFSVATISTALNVPTVVAPLPDGRLLVAEQSGTLWVIKNGVQLPTSFTTLTVDATGERGLIGVVADPDFATNGYVYLYHTVPGSPARNRISRFTASGDVAQPGSHTTILDLTPLSGATNHNGGSMVFGPDKKLYVGVGDNASNPANAQNLDTYLGKVLRLNPDGTPAPGNPYPTGSAPRQRLWSYGLRNPYTLAMQPETGRLFVNDVGQSAWEEINDATLPSLNFGWPNAEGNSANPAFTNPIYAYAHGSGDGVGCAIVGGTFYNPTLTRYPATYIGRYFYQDFCNNWINTLTLNGSSATRTAFADGVGSFNLSLAVGADDAIYFLSRGNNALYRLDYTGDVACRTQQAGTWQTASGWTCGQVPVGGVLAVVRHAVATSSSQASRASQVRFEAGGQLSILAGSQVRLGR
jgi:glucose/arabinose dehydrogenase